jgi:hypothetical protein
LWRGHGRHQGGRLATTHRRDHVDGRPADRRAEVARHGLGDPPDHAGVALRVDALATLQLTHVQVELVVDPVGVAVSTGRRQLG